MGLGYPEIGCPNFYINAQKAASVSSTGGLSTELILTLSYLEILPTYEFCDFYHLLELSCVAFFDPDTLAKVVRVHSG